MVIFGRNGRRDVSERNKFSGYNCLGAVSNGVKKSMINNAVHHRLTPLPPSVRYRVPFAFQLKSLLLEPEIRLRGRHVA